MNICIVDGNPSTGTGGLQSFLEGLVGGLTAGGTSVEEIRLRDLEMRYCTGCFGCWVKSPGECVFKDDSAGICSQVINSDLTLFASPVIMGFPSALLKKAHDRLLPLIHPYIEFVQGECHHRARYSRYPLFGLLLEKQSDTDQEDLDLVTEIYGRLALNFKSSLALSKTTETSPQEVCDEINSI